VFAVTLFNILSFCHIILALNHLLFGHDPFAATTSTGEMTVRPEVAKVVGGPAAASAAGAGDGVDGDLHRAYAAAGGAGHAG
jgi:hypothetical protein